MLRAKVAALFLVATVILAPVGAMAADFQNVKVNSVTVDRYGNVEITFTGGNITGNLCTAGYGANQVILAPGRNGLTVDTVRLIHSTVLAAYLAGKNIAWLSVKSPNPTTSSYCDWDGMLLAQ